MKGEWRIKGLEVEKYIGKLLKELVPGEIGVEPKSTEGDFMIGKYTIVEVKSAELCTSNGKNRPREREGRFWATPTAHNLLCVGGYVHWYVLTVTYKGLAVLIRCIPAKAITLHGNCIRMNTLYSKASVCIEKMIELALIQECENKK